MALALAGLCVLVVSADAVVRDREAAALTRSTAAGERTARHATAVVAAVVSYASPQLSAAGSPAAVRASLAQVVQGAAGREAPALQRRLEDVRAMRIPPWHSDLRRARTAVLAYLRARLDQLRAVAASYEAYGAVPPAQLRDLARQALVGAVGVVQANAALPTAVSP